MDLPELPPRVRSYLDAVVKSCTQSNLKLVSVLLFGSAAKGGFNREMSDVDLIAVLPKGATTEDQALLRAAIADLEVRYGFKEAVPERSSLRKLADRVGGNNLSCFVCTRDDLTSGKVNRVFGLSQVETIFIDRIVLANVIESAITVWGEDLLHLVQAPIVRRLDVFKAYFAFTNQIMLSLVAYAFLPDATRYAMGTLKRSLHSCYFCYQHTTIALEEEVEFFEQRLGKSDTIRQLLALRAQYENSFRFVVRCVPLLLHLHFRTAIDNSFPPHPQTRGP